MHNYQAPPELLRDRVILVTGAGDGIGRAAALGFAAHGATVVLLGRTLRKLEAVYDAIEAAGGPQPAIVPMNLETAAEHEFGAVADTIEQEFGRLHGLLHNAAQLALLSRIDDYDLVAWNRVLQVNLTAPFLLTQACLPLMRETGDGTILFTSDRIGQESRPFWGAYGITKYALEGFARMLAAELAGDSGIRVNCVVPTPCRTALRAAAFPGDDVNRLPPPERLMPTYLYLMGADGRALNGATIEAGAADD